MTSRSLQENKIRNAFTQQRSNAHKRGIEWQLTFEQWRALWGDKLKQRGRQSHQLCMARFNDSGAYAEDNVHIISSAKNCSDRARHALGLSEVEWAAEVANRAAAQMKRKAEWSERMAAAKAHRERRDQRREQMASSQAATGRAPADDSAALARITLLTREQVAKHLGISVWTLDDWVKKSVFPAPLRLSPGHPRKWRLVDVDIWLQRRIKKPADKPALRGAVKARAAQKRPR